ncbi:hypothetical protein TPHA_0N01180 [Tetrapisispora phaffii CBS 4417]|uniref:ABC1 atypical kinase-like domain-containing protein n=1 Tax=Tetrapisispora phaffii (strain ATCC 24235 / CBS 4417 / NBRC 1672 / NRRL Y-8282 / UCD 70-5) TaxID=1071381 RepID=G8C171_TETPH|nr:hypothetical protein TPHA_0N01180 [Tetrapisispora phaffii CBS 4417]CCE65899.1 hypothetical protein TPHA_0N01180 [Tetrapisispora phaffii CBS 4417]
MSRQNLYQYYCMLSGARSVIKGSGIVAKESLSTWVNTSTLTRPILNQFQWFHDPKWEQAKTLSNTIRYGGGKINIRQYSTQRSVKKNDSDDTVESGKVRILESSEVPTSRISRLFHYGSLAANVGANIAVKSISEASRGNRPSWKSLILSESNIEAIVKKFSKMRGAALKIGQMMSFQDDKLLPKELYEILSRVQNSANYMPQRQLDRVMRKELGSDWETKFFKTFNKTPLAAASIGQVHEAELKNGDKVVVKVQYPGVKDSIDSDLNNILMLLTASRLLPKGLFLDKTVANARRELKWECDYKREALALTKFRELVKNDSAFVVPKVYDELTTEAVLTMEKLEGAEIMKLPNDIPQSLRNFIGENIMRLCLNEIATFEFMQTDPNWANFLYNKKTNKVELLDFGASRPFPAGFVTAYRKLLTYARDIDYEGVKKMSIELGYLNGLESKSMVDAHIESIVTLCEVFRGKDTDVFPFSEQTVSDRIRSNIGLMLNERLCPPPDETYSLHRKFSGVFLLCSRLGADVHCAKLFNEIFYLKDEETVTK